MRVRRGSSINGSASEYQRRSAIAAWQPARLQALAADLPAQAWLTRLEYRGVLLTLDGLALNLQALTSVEAALTRVAGIRAGKSRRDPARRRGALAVQFYPDGSAR